MSVALDAQPMRRAALIWMSLATLASLAAACGNDRAIPSDGDPLSTRGAALYAQMCQVCHGETGEGGLGPVLQDTPLTHGALRDAISARMPQNSPGQCTGACADEIAAFIKTGLTSRALRCDAVPPGKRRLRLLTRREYRATVRDLLGTEALACSRATDCAFRDTCSTGTCTANACDVQTFVFDPHGRQLSTVHVAGSFNGWAATIAGGGLALTRDVTTGSWIGTAALGEGMHQYKLVLDEREWIADPRAPQSVGDGFGGSNSAFTLDCAGGDDPAAKLVADARPAGFPFDTDADAAVVTASHVDAYLAAAEPLAERAAQTCRGKPASCATELVAPRTARVPPAADRRRGRPLPRARGGGSRDGRAGRARVAALPLPVGARCSVRRSLPADGLRDRDRPRVHDLGLDAERRAALRRRRRRARSSGGHRALGARPDRRPARPRSDRRDGAAMGRRPGRADRRQARGSVPRLRRGDPPRARRGDPPVRRRRRVRRRSPVRGSADRRLHRARCGQRRVLRRAWHGPREL